MALMSTMRDILASCGLFVPSTPTVVEGGEQLSITSTDVGRVARSLEKKLRLQRDKVCDFVDEVTGFLSASPRCLALAMDPVGELDVHGHHEPCSSQQPQYSSSFLGQAPSLLKILLNVQSIQSAVMVHLVELLLDVSDVAVDEDAPTAVRDHDHGSGAGSKESLSVAAADMNGSHLAMRVVNHIRWCENIYDCGPLLGSIFGVLPGLSHTLQVQL